jgi:hypothetical protein
MPIVQTTIDFVSEHNYDRLHIDDGILCHNPTLSGCEDDTYTFEMGTWESSGTPETLEFDCKGQNTLNCSVLYIIGKILKPKCRKWACMGHLDICSTSYGKKKSWEPNWQFDSRPLKVGIDPTPVCEGGVRHTIKKLSTRATSFLSTSSQSEV